MTKFSHKPIQNLLQENVNMANIIDWSIGDIIFDINKTHSHWKVNENFSMPTNFWGKNTCIKIFSKPCVRKLPTISFVESWGREEFWYFFWGIQTGFLTRIRETFWHQHLTMHQKDHRPINLPKYNPNSKMSHKLCIHGLVNLPSINSCLRKSHKLIQSNKNNNILCFAMFKIILFANSLLMVVPSQKC